MRLPLASNVRPVTVDGWVSSFSIWPDWSNRRMIFPALAAIRPLPLSSAWVATCSTHLPPKLATSVTAPLAATRRTLPSSPLEMKPSPAESAAKSRIAPSWTVTVFQFPGVPGCINQTVPSPRAKPARLPSREKRVATTKASNGRERPLVFSRKAASVDWLMSWQCPLGEAWVVSRPRSPRSRGATAGGSGCGQ